ncbi:MAG: hypothetical protein KF814_04560 [Nitrospiraceae bacterium]|nr:hypothetical protein [Nitrospiraceae bacterium]
MRGITGWTGLIVCAAGLWLSGCGTNMHSDKQSVTIFSVPPGATLTVDNYIHLTTPGTVSLSRKSAHTAVAFKDGYENAELRIERSWSWWVLGDVFGCLIVFSPFCIYKDVHDGGFFAFDDEIYLTLDQRLPAASPPLK